MNLARMLVPLLMLTLVITTAHAQWRGHGGPVRALAVSLDGKTAISGSFDTTVIRWSVDKGSAAEVLRFHDGAVNALVLLPDGRFATSGEDARIAIWKPGETKPESVLEGHTAPVAGLAVSPDGSTLASASWDRTVRLWPLAGGAPRVIEANTNNVNAVAFSRDGKSIVTGGYDTTLRIFPLDGGTPDLFYGITGYNAVAIAPDGEIVLGGRDGTVHFRTPAGQRHREVDTGPDPLISLAVSPDGKLVAAASTRGVVAIIDRTKYERIRYLIGPGLPVWSVAFFPDSRTLLTGGTDRMIRRWIAATGEPIGDIVPGTPEDPLLPYAGDPGAEVFRACVACHTLKPGEGQRAGPTLFGLFGRHIATAPGYDFSMALRQMRIVWTPETVSKLFEVGPMVYTPGTKMPEQTLGAHDRAALLKFLERVTK